MIGVPVLEVNERDFLSYYSGTFLLHESTRSVCKVREMVGSNRVLCEVQSSSGAEAKTLPCSELTVAFPDVFYTKRGNLCGVRAGRSYKRAPYDIGCSLLEFWERIYGEEPSSSKRIGWQYVVRRHPVGSNLATVLFHRDIPVGILNGNTIHVDGIHRERLVEILARVGGSYELAELSGTTAA